VSQLNPPEPVKFLVAVFSTETSLIAEAINRVQTAVGPLDYISEIFVFDQTEYYRSEMGWPLYKRIVAIEAPMDPADLIRVKIACRKIEDDYCEGDRRRVNLDPGYVAKQRLVLGTGKDQAHRIYLGQGVYAELTLIYERGEFRSLPWTYPDFAGEQVRGFAADIRKRYLHQLQTIGRTQA
jgi:hypothetical protein